MKSRRQATGWGTVAAIVFRLVALTAVGGALLVGTAAAAGNTAGTPVGTVAFVGDSNLLYGGSAFDLTLSDRAHGYIVVNVARSGATIRSEDGAYWTARLAALKAAVRVDAYVINLGINDTVSPGTSTTNGYAKYGEKIDWLLGQLKSSTPVIWSNLPCQIEPPQRAAGCAAVNNALAAATSRHPNLTVADWATAANDHPEWISGIHYTTRGLVEYAFLIFDALAQLH
jgi:hypothetical protein